MQLLSLTLLLLSEFLPWPEGAVCVAGPWHDKPRFSRGGRRILGGVLTGEAWVSQSCRYTEVTRPECSRRTGLLKNRRGHAEGWAQFLPRVLLFSGNGLLSAPRLYNSSSSKPGYMYLSSCVYIGTCLRTSEFFVRDGPLIYLYFFCSKTCCEAWVALTIQSSERSSHS